MPTVLIVEDQPLIALGLRLVIMEATSADVLVVTTVDDAVPKLSERLDFALLDVNVGPDTSFDLARDLAARGVPFAFASGASRDLIPFDLRDAVFLAKPCSAHILIDAVRSALARSHLSESRIAF